MGILATTFRFGCVCLTAVTTLIAGLPHFQCRCPDGHIKTFCLGYITQTSGCCCGHSCCGDAPTATNRPHDTAQPKPKKSCCCHQEESETVQGPAGGPECQPLGCSKTLAEQSPRVATSDRPSVDPEMSGTLFVVMPPAFTLSALHATTGQPWGEIHPPGPPTDHITVLQRLLI